MNEAQAIISSQAPAVNQGIQSGKEITQAAGLQEGEKAATQPVKAQEDQDFSRKFAALSKRQKELFMKEQALKEQENKYKPWEELEKIKESNPLEFLKKSGLSLDKVIEMALKEGEPPTVDDKVSAMEKKYNELLQKLEAKEHEAKELEARKKEEENQKTIDAFRNNLHDELKSKADKYELINSLGVFDTVYDVIAEKFQQTGEVISTDEAADLVEGYYYKEAQKLKNVKKLWQSSETTEEKPSTTVKTDGQPSTTLTSAIKAQSSAPSDDTGMSFEERKAKALQLMRSQGFR